MTEDGKKCLCIVFQLTRRLHMHGKNTFFGILLGSSVKLVFIIFGARSPKRSQLPLLGQFLSIEIEVEPRIANQYKCHHCCINLQTSQGRGDGGLKKVSLPHFSADPKSMSLWKKISFLASYSISNKTCHCLSPDTP